MSTILKPFLLAVTLMLILIRPGFATEDGAITMVKTYSAYDYLQTRARLMHAVADHGLVLFGEFDHARAAQNVNLKMPPTTVLVFGNPKGGTPLMLAHPELALDLPFRVLISQQADGRTLVSYHPAETLQRYGLDAADIQALKKLEQLVEKVSTKAENLASIGRCVCTGDVANKCAHIVHYLMRQGGIEGGAISITEPVPRIVHFTLHPGSLFQRLSHGEGIKRRLITRDNNQCRTERRKMKVLAYTGTVIANDAIA